MLYKILFILCTQLPVHYDLILVNVPFSDILVHFILKILEVSLFLLTEAFLRL